MPFAYLDGSVAMAKVCCHANHVCDIIKRQLGNLPVHLKKKSQRLTDTTGCSEQSDLAALDGQTCLPGRAGTCWRPGNEAPAGRGPKGPAAG